MNIYLSVSSMNSFITNIINNILETSHMGFLCFFNLLKISFILNFFFNKQSQEEMFLFLCYLGFYFEEEQEYSIYTKLSSTKFINEFIL